MAPHLQLYTIKAGNRTQDVWPSHSYDHTKNVVAASKKSQAVEQTSGTVPVSKLDPRRFDGDDGRGGRVGDDASEKTSMYSIPLAVPITLQDGDALWIPSAWWHYVEASDGITMALSFKTTSRSTTHNFIEHPCEEDTVAEFGRSTTL